MCLNTRTCSPLKAQAEEVVILQAGKGKAAETYTNSLRPSVG